MSAATSTPQVVHAIQLAIAPVFLLSGVGLFVTNLTNRLARIIDRARTVEDRMQAASDERRAEMRGELSMLAHRARMVNVALTLSITCALLVCLVIALLFVGSALRVDMDAAIAVMFVTAMAAMVVSLGIFLREIFLGTAQLRIGGRSH